MPTAEITNPVDLNLRLIVNEPDEDGEVRLTVDRGAERRMSIWLDEQARRDLIAALVATLPAEG